MKLTSKAKQNIMELIDNINHLGKNLSITKLIKMKKATSHYHRTLYFVTMHIAWKIGNYN